MIMRIKELRQKAGLTQIELANEMDAAQSSVASWETGAALPRTRELPALARALKCSIDDLFSAEALE